MHCSLYENKLHWIVISLWSNIISQDVFYYVFYFKYHRDYYITLVFCILCDHIDYEFTNLQNCTVNKAQQADLTKWQIATEGLFGDTHWSDPVGRSTAGARAKKSLA